MSELLPLAISDGMETTATTPTPALSAEAPPPVVAERSVDLRTLLSQHKATQAAPAPASQPVDAPVAEAAPEPVAEAPVIETPAVDPALARFEAMGFKGVTSIEEGYRRWEDSLRVQQEFVAKQAAPQSPAPAALEPVVEKKPSGPFSYLSEWAPVEASLVSQYREKVVGEDGKEITRWADDTPADLKNKAETFALQQRKWREDILTRPTELLDYLKSEAKAAAQAEAKQHLQQFEQQTAVQQQEAQIIHENPWLFENGVISKAGETALTEAQKFQDEGLPHDKALALAIRLAKAEQGIANTPAPPPAPRATPEQLEAQRAANILAAQKQAAAPQPIPQGTAADRRGTFPGSPLPTPQRPQNGNLGLGGQLAANLGLMVAN